MFDAFSVDRLSQAITHAIAPAFVLGAVASFVSVLTTRLATIVDRLRRLNALPEQGHANSHLRADVPRLIRRARLTNRAIFLSVCSGAIASALLALAFASAYLGIEHIYGAAFLFMVALMFLFAALVTFALEVRIALSTYDHYDPDHPST